MLYKEVFDNWWCRFLWYSFKERIVKRGSFENANFKSTLMNEEMLFKLYNYYHNNRKEIENRKDVSAHDKNAKMGIIRLLKWMI